MALLTVEKVKGFIETDQSDALLQLYMEDAEAEIIKRYGKHTAHTDTLEGGERLLFPTRAIHSVTSIKERRWGWTDEEITLGNSDYTLQDNGRSLLREIDGTNSWYRWGTHVILEYVPLNETKERKRVQLDLVKLALRYEALQNERSGNYGATFVDYERERGKILRRLESRLPFA